MKDEALRMALECVYHFEQQRHSLTSSCQSLQEHSGRLVLPNALGGHGDHLVFEPLTGNQHAEEPLHGC